MHPVRVVVHPQIASIPHLGNELGGQEGELVPLHESSVQGVGVLGEVPLGHFWVGVIGHVGDLPPAPLHR